MSALAKTIDQWRRLTDPKLHALRVMRLLAFDRVHQTTEYTEVDRYPELFSEVKTYLRNLERPRILSFGCSTGEEVISIRKYIPSAEIVGAEINSHSLAHCKNLSLDSGVAFIPSKPRLIRAHGPFDAIFCLAVLQRTPHLIEAQRLTNISSVYPFQRFDRQICELDSQLKAGGVFVIEHSQYLFSESSVGHKYSPLEMTYDVHTNRKFRNSGDLIGEYIRPPAIYVKRKA